MSDAATALVLEYFPAFRDRDAGWWSRHIDPGFVRHDPGLHFEVRGPEGIAKLASHIHGGFSDIDYPIVQTVTEGDRVLVHLRQVATHSGTFEGIAATGRRTDIIVMDLFRVQNDRLVEHWALMDNPSLLSRSAADPV